MKCFLLSILLGLMLSASRVCIAEEFHYQLAADYGLKDNGHAVLVMRDGKILFEKYDNGHTESTTHHLHSATKTFFGPVIAAMIQDGMISSYDELATKTLPEWNDDPRKSKITIRHLTDLTPGLVQDIPGLQGPSRPTHPPDLYKHAITLECRQEPGETFLYGPTSFYVLGEIMKRKLADKKQTPLDYLKKRILDPIGCQVGEWQHDKSGNPNIPNGAYITAREWAKFGKLLLDGGQHNGQQILRTDMLSFKGSKANPGYGLTAWLNTPGGKGTGAKTSQPTDKGSWVYRNGCPEIYLAGGAGGNRLYMVPSKNLVAVRMGETRVFSDEIFFGLLFDGVAPKEPAEAPAGRQAL